MKKFISVIGVLITSACIFALDIPVLSAHVNDYAGVMKNADKRKAEEYLSALENTTGIQIAILTIPSLEGESLESYSYNVAEKWQLGQNGKDNGALLLVAMKEKKVRIENGYGLEDTLTDTKSGLIIRNVILPEFRNGNYSEGILRGVQNMGGIASGNAELVSKSVSEPKNTSSGAESVLFGFLFVFMPCKRKAEPLASVDNFQQRIPSSAPHARCRIFFQRNTEQRLRLFRRLSRWRRSLRRRRSIWRMVGA